MLKCINSHVTILERQQNNNQDTPSDLFSFSQRNGTLPEVYTIHTGHDNWENFGYYDRINGMDTLPFWPTSPCNNIRASEGSLFPPRELTGEDTVHIYDKDVCRTLPFTYTRPVTENGKWEAYENNFFYLTENYANSKMAV